MTKQLQTHHQCVSPTLKMLPTVVFLGFVHMRATARLRMVQKYPASRASGVKNAPTLKD